MGLMQELSKYEDELIRDFHEHPYFDNFKSQNDKELKNALVQNTVLSGNFVPLYVRGMLGMNDSQGKEILRDIILEEMGLVEDPNLPGNVRRAGPTHAELLLQDLEQIGISRKEVIGVKQTKETQRARERMDELIPSVSDFDYDLKTLVGLRMAGEILVAEGYRHIVPAIKDRFGLEYSVFYEPHFMHDRKDSESGDHTHSFEKVLDRLINDERELGIALDAARKAYESRLSFYDQFSSNHKREIFTIMGNIAATAAAFVGLSFIPFNYDHPNDCNSCIPNEFFGVSQCENYQELNKN